MSATREQVRAEKAHGCFRFSVAEFTEQFEIFSDIQKEDFRLGARVILNTVKQKGENNNETKTS